MNPSLSAFDWPSFVALARSMGAIGMRAGSQEELCAALDSIVGTEGPVLLELIFDPDAVPRIRVLCEEPLCYQKANKRYGRQTLAKKSLMPLS